MTLDSFYQLLPTCTLGMHGERCIKQKMFRNKSFILGFFAKKLASKFVCWKSKEPTLDRSGS
jgi:hypothetical protein